MDIKQLITDHGGPAAFRRALAARGIDIPLPTVNGWSANGQAERTPPVWTSAALEIVLNKSC